MNTHTRRPGRSTGCMAEFDDPEDVVAATQQAYDRGYRMMEAYTPFPGRRAGRGARVSSQPDSARSCLIGGLLGRTRRLLHAVVLGGGPLSAQYRRPAVQ